MGGGGGVESGSLRKKRFEKRYIAVLIKILFELNRLVELQNVVRIRILFYAAKRGAYNISGVGS